MKRIYPILFAMACSWLGLACTENALPEAVPEPWNVTVSRADTGTDNDEYNRILILGMKEGIDESVQGVLTIEDATGNWEDDTPTWPRKDEQDVTLDIYAISPVPAANALPQEVDLSNGQGTAWQIDYKDDQTKPETLTLNMTHLLAKLVVHIRIDGEVNPQPADGSIRLYAKGEINYPNKQVTTTEQADVPLGIFHQEGQDEHSTEHNWEMETAIVVIPQEIPAGKDCLWFTAGGCTYIFTPQTDLKLEAGVVNNLYLGVAVDGPVLLEGISVTDWVETDINGGEADEQ